MGEKVEDLGTLRIGDHVFDVEANLLVGFGGQMDIHIQNNSGRMQLLERDYIKLLAKLIEARDLLENIKGRNRG